MSAPTTKAPIEGDYLFLKYLEEFEEVRPHHLNNLKSRWIRFSVAILAILSNIDVCSKARGLRAVREPRKWWRPQPFGVKYMKHSDWWRRQRYTWIADIFLVFYFVSSFYLISNMYHQYSLDFNKLRLMRIQAMLRHGLISGQEFERLATLLLVRIDDTTIVLRSIGAPNRHMSILIECLYGYIFLFALIMYYGSYLFYRLVSPCDFHFLRELLDNEQEQRYLNELIEGQLLQFIGSNNVFANLHLTGFQNSCILRDRPRHRERPFTAAPAAAAAATAPPSPIEKGPISPQRSVHEPGNMPIGPPVELSQYEVYEILIRMHHNGALRPYNKSLDSLERRNNQLFITSLFMLGFSFIFFPTLMLGFLEQRDTSTELSWQDCLAISSLSALIFMIGCCVGLEGSLFFTSALDQVVMVGKIRQLILACIESNSREFQKLNGTRTLYCSVKKSPGSSTMRCAQAKLIRSLEKSMRQSALKINTNFLFVFMQYKIFLAQYHPARQVFWAAVSFITSAVLLILVIIKLHMPYLSMFEFTNIKRFAVAMSVASLLPANFVLLPICHLDARFINLFRTLSSLIAHVIEVESHPNGRGVHDEHAVSLLLREMRHTYQFKDRSNTEVAGLAATYTTLVKAHFWLGLVALSILVDNQDYDDISQLSSSLTSDPFGVFSHSKLLEIE